MPVCSSIITCLSMPYEADDLEVNCHGYHYPLASHSLEKKIHNYIRDLSGVPVKPSMSANLL